MTGPFPLSFSHPDDEPDYILSNQTLMGVSLKDAPSAAMKRWREKCARVRRARRAFVPGLELHRIKGADGATRWFDSYGRMVARTAQRDCERCAITRLNEELAPTPRESNHAPVLLGAALIVVALAIFLVAFVR